MSARSSAQHVRLNPKEAEAVAIREALSWLRDKALDNIIVESDALQVINCIRGQQDDSHCGLVVGDCSQLLGSFTNVSIRFVRRSANVVAHVCAKAAIFISGLKEWTTPPDFLSSVLCS